MHNILANHFQESSVIESTKDAPKDRTTLVVFLGLLIDLLGERKMRKVHWLSGQLISAFTLILPLFPALIGHYRENDSSGLFAYLETKVPSTFENQANAIKWKRLTGSVAWWGLQLSSTLCCLVDFWEVSSHFFRWWMCRYFLISNFHFPSILPVQSLGASVIAMEENPCCSYQLLVKIIYMK